MAKESNLKPFKKGEDPRRNTKGRPKSISALQEIAQEISHEEVQNGKGEKAIIAEAILRKLASSKNTKDNVVFLEYAYGKLATNSNVNLDVTQLSDDDLQRIVKS